MVDVAELIGELEFRTSRSSGAGGQHVNKTETRVELRFDIDRSMVLDEEQRWMLKGRLQSRLVRDSVLILTEQNSRSQLRNKQLVVERFVGLIRAALVKPKKRKATKPTKASQLKRRENKKRQSDKKRLRGERF